MTTHRERLQAALRGEILDRPPVALWRHFPVDDQTPEGLAAAVVHWQRLYEWDLVKVTPASSFCLKDWGAQDEWRGATEGTRDYTRRVIQNPQDWERLPVLGPDAPHLAGQLAALRLIRAELGPETPILQTIFNPLSQAKNLAGPETLLAHLRLYPEAVLKGLETITKTTRRFIEAMLADKTIALDGIFFAVQHAQATLLSRQEYEVFGVPFDEPLLASARDLWCNLLHLHGQDIYFDLASRYRCAIVNWHDRETAPSLQEARRLFNGVVCGGVSRKTLALGTPDEVRREAEDALKQTAGQHFLLGTGCVTPIITPHGNILALAQSAGRMENRHER